MEEECRGIINRKTRFDFFPSVTGAHRQIQTLSHHCPHLKSGLPSPKKGSKKLKEQSENRSRLPKRNQSRRRAGRVKTEIAEAARSLLCLITGNSAHQTPQQENLTSVPAQIPSPDWFLQELPFDQR